MDILNCSIDKVLFSAESETIKELLIAATKAGANLSGANLRGADLRESNLRGADLYESNLCGANLRGADLSEADLGWANLRWANLRGADLHGANLYGANLYGADLYGANLRGTDLREANLRGTDAKINGHSIISINGLTYPILITDTHLRARCQNHTFAEWRAMTPEQIEAMDGEHATAFYPMLISLIDTLCKDREASEAK